MHKTAFLELLPGNPSRGYQAGRPCSLIWAQPQSPTHRIQYKPPQFMSFNATLSVWSPNRSLLQLELKMLLWQTQAGLCVPRAGMCPAQHANASAAAWEPSAASPRLPGTSKGTESHNRLSWTGPSRASSGVNGSFGDGTLTLVLSAPHQLTELRHHIQFMELS